MKIDKTKPAHWIYLSLFTVTVCLATLLRMLRLARPGNICLLYGHKLNGNLKGIYDFSRSDANSDTAMRFLTMDLAYYRQLKNDGHDVINGLNPLNAGTIASAFAVVADHGLHSLGLLHRFTDIPFFDVWHAIPLKGFDADDFRAQHQYEKIFVTSDLIKRTYIDKFGFHERQLQTAGYSRTDILINRSADTDRIKSRLGLSDTSKKVILFAPTWQQDDPQRNILPFGMQANDFFRIVEDICQKLNSVCIFRTHLNSKDVDLSDYPSLLFRPHSDYPDTEEILLITDCLVSDWSSIVFDFMLLDRPTIFLDVPHPFKKGFSLSPEHRFGKLVSGIDELRTSLEIYLESPQEYMNEFKISHGTTKHAMYDGNADGQASERVCRAIERYRI